MTQPDSSQSSDSQRIAIAKIAKTHGLRGEMRVVAYNPDTTVLVAGLEVVLRATGREESRRLRTAHRHGQHFLITIEGCASIDDAETLVGSELWVARDQLPDTDPDEIYHFELIGMQVLTVDGEDLGVIDEVIGAGGNDVCVVHGKRGEKLIPMIADVIKEIDKTARRLIIDPIPGLLDD